MEKHKEIVKVTHILNDISFSGAEIMLKDAAGLFQKKGIDLYAISTGSSVGDYAPILQDAGYTIKHIPFQKSIKFLIKIGNYIKKEKIDILHIHTERAFIYYSIIGKIYGIKILIRTIHNVFPFKGLLGMIRYFQRWIARNILDVKFLSIGDSVDEVERRTYGNRTKIIRNWIDFTKFYPIQNALEKQKLRTEIGLPTDKHVIISVGKCIFSKNHKDIIRAMSLIRDDLLEELLYLHIGIGELNDEEKKLSKELNLDKNIVFFGTTDRIRDLLVASDIFVMTSLYEGLGNSLLEAMSCGLPSIVYNVYGLKDLIVNGENGIIIESSPEILASEIQNLVNDQNRKDKFSLKSREKILREYNIEQSVSQIIQQYGIS